MTGTALRTTKLLVSDLDGAARFYGVVAGLTEGMRLKTSSGATEIMLNGGGAASFMLLERLASSDRPQTSSVVLVFTTDDAVAFGQRTEAAGGTIVHGAREVNAGGRRFMIVMAADPEGNTLEAIQQVA